jgi:hypothetical protein
MNTEKNSTAPTTVDTQNWEGNFKDSEKFGEMVEHTEQVVAAPIFIIFAEYMGYVSQFNKMAENWCDGKVPEVHVQKVMMLEARCIYRQMMKDFTLEEVRYYYDSYYPLILKEYVDSLAEIVKE